MPQNNIFGHFNVMSSGPSNGVPIITLDYITASEAHGSFLETGPFEVVNIRGLDDHAKKTHQKWLSRMQEGWNLQRQDYIR